MLLVVAPASATREVPRLEGRVTDLAGLLGPSERAALEAKLAAFEADTTHQIAVLTVAGELDEPIESFSLRVAETWALGHEDLDNGVLLVVVPAERSMRIEVGYGLEGAVPDVTAKRIIEDVIAPRFRAGEMGAGLAAGVDALIAAAKGEFVPPERRPERRPGSGGPGAFLAALFFGTVWSGVLGGLRRPLGALIGGAVGGGLAWLFTGSLFFALGAAFLACLFGLMISNAQLAHPRRVGRGRGTWTGSGPWTGGGLGGGGFGGGFGGGGFGGGGGGFGGGGASGGW